MAVDLGEPNIGRVTPNAAATTTSARSAPPVGGLAHEGALSRRLLDFLGRVLPEGSDGKNHHALAFDPVSDVELVADFPWQPMLGHEV